MGLSGYEIEKCKLTSIPAKVGITSLNLNSAEIYSGTRSGFPVNANKKAPTDQSSNQANGGKGFCRLCRMLPWL